MTLPVLLTDRELQLLAGACAYCAEVDAEDDRPEAEKLFRLSGKMDALRRPGGPAYLVARFDVTGLTQEQVDYLTGEVVVQAERSEGHPSVPVEVLP